MADATGLKVFAVQGNWDYEGGDNESLKLFSKEADAKAYAAELTDQTKGMLAYDSFTISERTVL